MDRTARPSLSDSEHRSQLRRALVASTIGTTIEWYDFLLYSTVTGLVFAKIFFPASDPLIGTLQAYVIFYIGFIARPVGAAIFGHYGDRIGRKASLIATLVITGLATVAVGLVPTYEQIGIWAALIMIVLRFIQGVGVGGEWGGSVLMSMEWAQTNANRGFIASWPQFGGPAGIALANLAVLAFSEISGDQFLVWGWRIPFLISIIMVGVGLYIRLGVLETPVFAELVEKERLSSSPVVEVLRRQPKEVILSAFVRMGEQGPGYVYIAFIFTYGTQVLGVSRDLLLSGMVTAATLGFLWVPVAGHLSDRIGRKRIIVAGCVAAMLTLFPIFRGLTHFANPALAQFEERAAITVAARDCHFNIFAKPSTPCDRARDFLTKAGLSYESLPFNGADDVVTGVAGESLVGFDEAGGYNQADAEGFRIR
jgi:MFS family permease